MTTPALARRIALLALVLAAAALAGCATDEPTDQPDPLSAKEAVEEARPTVDAWNESAELLVLSGFEGGEASPAVTRERTDEQEQAFPVYGDSLPGDGRAPQWTMVFLAGNETRSLRVSSQETVWMDDGPQQAGPGAQPIANWTIDSTDAVDRVAEASARWDRLVAADDVSVFFTLGGGSQGPRWQVQANSHSQGEQVALFVDARSGEIENRTQAQTTSRTEAFQGRLSADRNATHPLTVAENGTRVAVELTWNASAGGDGVRLSAELRQNGTSVGEPAEAGRGEDRFQARWDRVAPGDYQVHVHADDWGEREQVDYELRVHVG